MTHTKEMFAVTHLETIHSSSSSSNSGSRSHSSGGGGGGGGGGIKTFTHAVNKSKNILPLNP